MVLKLYTIYPFFVLLCFLYLINGIPQLTPANGYIGYFLVIFLYSVEPQPILNYFPLLGCHGAFKLLHFFTVIERQTELPPEWLFLQHIPQMYNITSQAVSVQYTTLQYNTIPRCIHVHRSYLGSSDSSNCQQTQLHIENRFQRSRKWKTKKKKGLHLKWKIAFTTVHLLNCRECRLDYSSFTFLRAGCL